MRWSKYCGAAAFAACVLASTGAAAQSSPQDLIQACSAELAAMRALPTISGGVQSESSFIASRDAMANTWSSSPDAGELRARVAEDVAWRAANPDNGTRGSHALHVQSLVNDCMIRRQLVVLAQPAAQPQRQAAAPPQRTQTYVPQNASSTYQAEWQRSCQPAVDEFEAAVQAQNPQYRSVAPQMALLNDYRAGKIETANASRAQLEELRANAERRRAAPDATRQARAYGGMILCGYQVRDRLLRDQEQNAQRQAQGQQAQRDVPPASRNQRTALNASAAKPQPAPEKKKLTAETAHECITLFVGPTDYGGFTNKCDFTVKFMYCNLNPNPKTDAKWADCAKHKVGDGIDGVGAHGDTAGFTKSAKYTYWFACKAPSVPKAIEYRPGVGLWGGCG